MPMWLRNQMRRAYYEKIALKLNFSINVGFLPENTLLMTVCFPMLVESSLKRCALFVNRPNQPILHNIAD